MGYIPYQWVILAFRGIFLPEKRVLQDMICCPSAVNECPFERTYYSIFGKECFVFGNIICCPFRMKCLAPYTVPLGPRINGEKEKRRRKKKQEENDKKHEIVWHGAKNVWQVPKFQSSQVHKFQNSQVPKLPSSQAPKLPSS